MAWSRLYLIFMTTDAIMTLSSVCCVCVIWRGYDRSAQQDGEDMGRRTLASLAIGGLLATLTACGGPRPGVFHPAGSTQATETPATQAHVSGLATFNFPAGIRIMFEAPPSSLGAMQQGAVVGYENYVDSMWYAAATHGTSQAYKSYTYGNALTFVRNLAAEFTRYDLQGTIVYADIAVPNTYGKSGAVVTSCVNTTDFFRVNPADKQATSVFGSAKWDDYEEQVAAGKKPDGQWVVNGTYNYPASDGGAAGECAQ
jgi:hypothetical protein